MGKIDSLRSIYTEAKGFVPRIARQFGISAAEKSASIMEETSSAARNAQVESWYRRYGKVADRAAHSGAESKADIGFLQKYNPLGKLKKALDNYLCRKMESINAELNVFNTKRLYSVSDSALDKLGKLSEEKKNAVINIFIRNKNIPKEVRQELKKGVSLDYLAQYIRSYLHLSVFKFSQTKFFTEKYAKAMPLEIEQELAKVKFQAYKDYLEILKLVTEPSKDERVLQIEHLLKSMYGMEYVHLENLDEAKKILQTIKLVRKNNIPLPKNIIVTPYTPILTDGFNILNSDYSHSVILRSTKEHNAKFKDAYSRLKTFIGKKAARNCFKNEPKMLSTDNPLHLYAHEFCHDKQFMFFLSKYQNKKLPKRFADLPEQVGVYASKSQDLTELENEIVTKSLFMNLNKMENDFVSYCA